MRSLWVTFWRVLPGLLTAEWSDVEIAPRAPHRLVATVVDEICAEHALAVAEEHVVAVPFIDAEIFVEAVGDGVPRNVPLHPLFESRDVRLRRARDVGERGVALIQVRQVGDLVGAE